MRVFTKLHHLLGRRARLQRLEEEMQTHLEMLVEEGVRAGLPPAEARRRAQLAFGNTLATREETEESLGWPVLESFGRDLRLACRSLVRRPLLALCIVLVLALGIGATGAITALVRSVLFAPLPVPRPEEIHLVAASDGAPQLLTAPTLQRLAADPAFRGGIAGYSDPCRVALRLADQAAEPASVQFVTGDFFAALAFGPAQGRLLNAGDDRSGDSAPVAVVSWEFWRRRWGAEAPVVDRKVRLNGVEVTVIGVAPATFRGVTLGREVDFWLPLAGQSTLRASPSSWSITEDGPVPLADWVRDDRVSWLNVLLRLPPAAQAGAGDALAAAWQPHLTRILAILTDPQEGTAYAKRAPRLVAAPRGYSELRDGFRRVGATLSLLVAAVVFVAAANAATLLLLRTLARTRELGVRLALGASRARVVRGALMEGLVLAVAGAGVGVLVAWWLTPLLARWLAPGTARAVTLDASLVGLLAGAAVLLGLALGAAPAWFGARLAPQTALQRQVGGPRGSLRLGRALIVVQLALSVVLIATAGALALDLRRTLAANYGFARASVLTASFDFGNAGIEVGRQGAVLDRLRLAAQELPQVQAVGFAAGGPLSGSRSRSRIFVRGAATQTPGEGTQHESVDPEYFRTLDLPLLQGRGITAADTAERPRVTVISRRLAQELFGDADPIGRRFGFGPEADDEDWEIVGVVADARVNSVHEAPPAIFYTPLPQWRRAAGCVVVRVAGDAGGVRRVIAARISAAEPSLLFTRWGTLQERIEDGVHNDAATVRLTAGFGLLATGLAGIGVFGALGYLVATRARDIAVRLAVGAAPAAVWREVVVEALQLGGLGAASGAVLAWLLPHWVGAWLTGALRLDWAAVAGAVLVGLLAAVLGGLWPARRAARVDPLALLKAE